MNTNNHLLFQLNLKNLLQQKVNYQLTAVVIAIAALHITLLMIIIQGQYIRPSVLAIGFLFVLLCGKASAVITEKKRIIAKINGITAPEEELILINKIEAEIHKI